MKHSYTYNQKKTPVLSPLLKLVGDASRLKLLSVLQHGSYCVSELIASTGLSQSLISHHLKDLKDGMLVESQRNGKWVYYTLTPKGQKIVLEMAGLPKEKQSLSVSPLLKLVGDASRLKLLSVLQHGSYCVSELIASTGLSQSLISHHLKDLKDEGLFRSERNGKWMYYVLTAKGQHIVSVLYTL